MPHVSLMRGWGQAGSTKISILQPVLGPRFGAGIRARNQSLAIEL